MTMRALIELDHMYIQVDPVDILSRCYFSLLEQGGLESSWLQCLTEYG